jgi:hypothetical protein
MGEMNLNDTVILPTPDQNNPTQQETTEDFAEIKEEEDDDEPIIFSRTTHRHMNSATDPENFINNDQSMDDNDGSIKSEPNSDCECDFYDDEELDNAVKEEPDDGSADESDADEPNDNEASNSNADQEDHVEQPVDDSNKIPNKKAKSTRSKRKAKGDSSKLKKQPRVEQEESGDETEIEDDTEPKVSLSIIVHKLKCTVDGCKKLFNDRTAFNKHLLDKHQIQGRRCLIRDCGRSFSDRFVLIFILDFYLHIYKITYH